MTLFKLKLQEISEKTAIEQNSKIVLAKDEDD